MMSNDYKEVDFPSNSMEEVDDPRKPGGKKWRIGKWIKHLKRREMLNLRSIEKGGFPMVYAHWMSITEEQRAFLKSLDEYDYHSFFNMYTFTHDSDAVQFKLLAG